LTSSLIEFEEIFNRIKVVNKLNEIKNTSFVIWLKNRKDVGRTRNGNTPNNESALLMLSKRKILNKDDAPIAIKKLEIGRKIDGSVVPVIAKTPDRTPIIPKPLGFNSHSLQPMVMIS